MHVRVKICGITDAADANAAVASGADAVGFVFAESPRRVTPEGARRIADTLPPFIATVAVFHHPTLQEIDDVVSVFRPTVIQTEPVDLAGRTDTPTMLPVFHDEPAIDEVVRRFRGEHTTVRTILLEAAGRGGSGRQADWTRAAAIANAGATVLAGGLTPKNVADAIRTVRPYAVDVASGVEARPGVKDPQRVEAFLAAVREAETHLAGLGASSEWLT